MDVLVVGGKLDLPRLHVRQNARQALGDGLRVLPGDDAAVPQHPRVGHASLYVLPVHPAVKVDGGVEIVD